MNPRYSLPYYGDLHPALRPLYDKHMPTEYSSIGDKLWDRALMNGSSDTRGIVVHDIAAMQEQWRAIEDRWLNRPRQNDHTNHVHVALYDNTEKESTMNRTEVVTAEIARLQKELSERARFGEDHEDGTILSFDADYHAVDGKVYRYAAIRTGGRWHPTGFRSQSNLTWDGMVDFLLHANATNVRKHGKGKAITE